MLRPWPLIHGHEKSINLVHSLSTNVCANFENNQSNAFVGGSGWILGYSNNTGDNIDNDNDDEFSQQS